MSPKPKIYSDKMELDVNQRYSAVHYWLKSRYGKATKCSNKSCQKWSKVYQWALKKGCKYEFNVKNFIQLCKSCHIKYDFKENTSKKMSESSRNTSKTQCIKGHVFSEQNTYTFTNSTGGLSRACKMCSKARCANYRNKKLIKNKITMQSNINTVLEEFEDKFTFLDYTGIRRISTFIANDRKLDEEYYEDDQTRMIKNFISTSIQQLLAQRDEEIIKMIEDTFYGANEPKIKDITNKIKQLGI